MTDITRRQKYALAERELVDGWGALEYSCRGKMNVIPVTNTIRDHASLPFGPR